jgi:ubiquinone/menaquinone biosynthesis C-methylase UbiE
MPGQSISVKHSDQPSNSSHQELTVQGPTRNPASRVRQAYAKGGFVYCTLYTLRAAGHRLLETLDRSLVRIEQRRVIVEPWTISAKRHTSSINKSLWNTYDWSAAGEEWTKSENWKIGLVKEYLEPHMPPQGNLLEIGPGGGRWTEFLQLRAERLTVVDVAEKPIELCRARFANCKHLQFHVGDGRTLPSASDSLDGIWSYDVFVHITPLDVQNYLHEFKRALKPGAFAVIHHAGEPLPGHTRRPGWRSDLTANMFQQLVNEAGLKLVCRTEKYVNPGDVLSVLQKPTC